MLGAVVLAGCAGTQSTVPTCGELVPARTTADVLGDPDGKLVRLHTPQPHSVSPLVDEMVADGIACGGSVNGAPLLDGAVMVGALAMSKDEWRTVRAAFATDGHAVSDDLGVPGWVSVPKPDNDPTAGSGFAWKDGVLYYAMNPILLALAPAFAS